MNESLPVAVVSSAGQSSRSKRQLVIWRLVACMGALLLAAGCGGGDGSGSSAEVGPEALDLDNKPAVPEQFLGDVSELVITDLVEGTGKEATPGSVVSMQYVGVLASNGNQFDASWDRGPRPFTFELDRRQVIAGWDQGIQGMKVGGRRVLQIPDDLAYGEASPGPDIPAGSDLVFIVDLTEVGPPPTPPPPTPAPIPAPPVPEDALGSFDELGVIDLVEGSGRKVAVGDIVSVQYVGVFADGGDEFDSSWSRGGQSFRFVAGVAGVIDGWKEGVIGAQAGTERILQIPSEMGYGEGDLVFRIHVEEIIDAPQAHQLTFEGDAPSQVESTTLVAGTGEGASEGQVVSARVVVIRHSDSEILQSGYRDPSPTPLLISPAQTLPGLNDGLMGIAVGELRQVIVPVDIAYPEGAPEGSQLESGDALVFVVEAFGIDTPDQ